MDAAGRGPTARERQDGRTATDLRTQCAPEVRTDPLPRALRLARRRGKHEAGDESPDGLQLVRVALGEVLVAQALGVGRHVPDAFRASALATSVSLMPASIGPNAAQLLRPRSREGDSNPWPAHYE